MFNYGSSLGLGNKTLCFKGKSINNNSSLPTVSGNYKVKHGLDKLNGGFHSKTGVCAFYFRAIKRALKMSK